MPDAGTDAGRPAHAAALRRTGPSSSSSTRRSSPPRRRAVSGPPTARGRERTRRLGGVLDDLGISETGRVATFAWNTARHLELYFAAPVHGPGAAHPQHPAVPRAAHLHREPRRGRGDLRRPVAARAPVAPASTVRDGPPLRGHGRRQGRGAQPGRRAGRSTTTRTCWLPPTPWTSTSTTRTGPRRCATRAAPPATPRASSTPTAPRTCTRSGRWSSSGLGVQESDRILPVVPMFHANAWGLAHAAVAVGATLVMPGPDLSAPAVADAHRGGEGHDRGRRADDLDGRAARAEGPRHLVAAGHPVRRLGGAPGAVGGATGSRPGLPILQAWGMTETSPIASVGRIKSTLDAVLDDEGRADLRTTVGQPSICVEPASSRPGEHRGAAVGRREPPASSRCGGRGSRPTYYDDDRSPESFTDDGWLKTGDVAAIDAPRLHPPGRPHQGRHQVRRRVDQLGRPGERADGPPDGRRGRGDRHPPREVGGAPAGLRGAEARGRSSRRRSSSPASTPRVAKWWLPDDVAFVDEIPKTSVGKFSKKDLRAKFEGYQLPEGFS